MGVALDTVPLPRVHSAPSVTQHVRRQRSVPRAEGVRYSRLDATRLFLVCVAALCAAGVAGQAPKIDTSKIGPQVGQHVPDFSGTDQFGRKHSLTSSLRAKGAMLVFFRSADW